MRRARSVCTGCLPGLLALALALGSMGCTKAVLYTYVSVHVMIDPGTVSADELYQVSSCVFNVASAEATQPRSLRCPPHNVNFDVGTFEWETQLQEGTLQFVVQIFDSNRVLLGEGTTESVPISPGKHLTASVLVKAIAPPVPDGGTGSDGAAGDGGDAAAGTDGATESTTSSDATSDGPSGDAGDDASTDGLEAD